MSYDPHEHPKDKVQRYIDGVLSGDVVAGKYVIKAVQRHVDDLATAGDRGFYFDEDAATKACMFFPLCLRHYAGEWAGQPFALSDNQAFIVWCLWGWRRIETRMRRFRTAYITAARKWGKSTFCAGIALLSICCESPPEPGAEVYCVATKMAQARIVFDTAAAIRSRSPAIQEYTEKQQAFIRSLPNTPQPDSIFRFIGSDSDTTDGLNIHCAILDELHAWKSKQHSGLWNVLTTASGSRRQPLLVIITTAGDESSEIWSRRDTNSVAILDAAERGESLGDNHFAFIARVDEKDDVFDPANWPKANPNYPVTPRPEYLQEQADECKLSAVDTAKFTRYHANRQVSSVNKAIDDRLWIRAEGQFGDWSKADYIGGGFDLGSHDDLAAAARVAKFDTGDVEQDEDSGEETRVYRYEIECQSWIDEYSKRNLNVDPWATWVANGSLNVTTQAITDVERYLLTNDCDGVAFDQNNARRSAEAFQAQRGEEWAVKMPQVASHYNEPIRAFINLLKRGLIVHNGDPVLAWAVSNLHLKENSRREVIPAKPNSEAKIDPIVAVFMAFRMAFFADNVGPRGNYYESNPLELG